MIHNEFFRHQIRAVQKTERDAVSHGEKLASVSGLGRRHDVAARDQIEKLARRAGALIEHKVEKAAGKRGIIALARNRVVTPCSATAAAIVSGLRKPAGRITSSAPLSNAPQISKTDASKAKGDAWTKVWSGKTRM